MLLGIDVGGTSIKYGLVHATGQIAEQWSVPTQASDGLEAVLDRIVAAGRHLLNRNPGAPIGIGVPGVVDPHTKHVQSPPNLPGWDRVPLQAIVSEALGVPVVVENDANAGAVAELRAGAGKMLRDFLYVTLGTGVGGGIVINNQLYTGPHGDAGEIGHIYLGTDDSSVVLEQVIGRMGILHRYGGGPEVDVADIDSRASGGEEHAIRVMIDTGRLLGMGLCSMLAVLGLRNVVVGGGISRSELILETARRTVQERAIPTIARSAQIVPAHFLNDAGLVGAAMLSAS